MAKKEEVIIPVVEETAVVTKREVDRGGVRVRKVVHEREEVIDTSTYYEEIEVEHVARNQWIKKPLKPRTEGDTVIIPIMEEVVVTETRLLLREEVYIRRKKIKTPKSETVKLRR
jgi:stress response protein YsnF